MNKIFTVFSMLFALLFVSIFVFKCGNGSSSTGTGGAASVSNTNTLDQFSDILTVQKGTKVVLDSPDKVIQIWILLNIDQKKWFKELADSVGASNTNSDLDEKSAKFLEEKKIQFYKDYGLTEKDLIQYNKIHSKDIYDFMDKNPRYKQAYNQSM
ncbi:MAG: hypothetical protein ABSG94_08695 [Brevinematales bacterium]